MCTHTQQSPEGDGGWEGGKVDEDDSSKDLGVKSICDVTLVVLVAPLYVSNHPAKWLTSTGQRVFRWGTSKDGNCGETILILSLFMCMCCRKSKAPWLLIVFTPARSGVQAEHGIIGLGSVLQQLLLKADNGAKHRFVLDLCGRDDNAAVHEVVQGVLQLKVAPCLKRCLIENLGFEIVKGILGLHITGSGSIWQGVHAHFVLSITLLQSGSTFLCSKHFFCLHSFYCLESFATIYPVMSEIFFF